MSASALQRLIGVNKSVLNALVKAVKADIGDQATNPASRGTSQNVAMVPIR